MPDTPLASTDAVVPPPRRISPVAFAKEKDWWFETTFELPFLPQVGAEPSQPEHTILVFPLFRAEQLGAIRLWVNAAEVPIQLYAYPRNRKLSCRYADLMGSAAHGGKNRLVVFCGFEAEVSTRPVRDDTWENDLGKRQFA